MKRSMRLLPVHKRRKVYWLVTGRAYRDHRQRQGGWKSLHDHQLARELRANQQQQFKPVRRS